MMLSTCDKEDSTLLFNISLKKEEDFILVLRHQSTHAF
jgi:hypothetical protein